MAASEPSCSSSQPRVPDSRLPGSEPAWETEAGKKEAGSQQKDDAEPCDSYDCTSFLAWWPLIMLLTCVVTLTIATAWYGPMKLLQLILQYLVPERPGVWHMLAVWMAIVFCTTFGIPVLIFLLALPAMMFGFTKGLIISATAELAAACCSFVIGRYVAQRPVRQFLRGRGFSRILRMLHVLEDEEDQSMQLLILYRFLMMPMICRNYGPAVLRVPIWKLVVSAIPHSLWSGLVFATVGSALKGPAQLLRDGQKIAWRTPQWQQIGGLIVALTSFALFTAIAYRAYHRRVEAEELKASVVSGEEGRCSGNYGTNATGARLEASTAGC